MSAAIVKFKTGGYRETIERVECVRETEKSVYVFDTDWRGIKATKPTRSDKFSARTQYHDSWAEARAYLLIKAEDNVAACRRSLESANDKLGNIKGMKPPKDAQ